MTSDFFPLRYRFMAMDRLGSDLQKVCEHSGGQLKKATVLQLGQRLVRLPYWEKRQILVLLCLLIVV